ncbi:MAG: radical SAM family heme chaperone HemW [Lachnospiraceae bacterium]|nr:radical SAM family heme chaperone HemW [Lachnospiraceae bacterium]
MKKLSVYIHIPYCVRKCVYCDFLSFPCGSPYGIEHSLKGYIKALKRELSEAASVYPGYMIDTVFFGGGTPSLPDASYIADIMDALRSLFPFNDEAECSIECNPGTVNREKLDIYLQSGLNRISFGLQSVHERELKLLGRIHSYEDFERSLDAAIAAGFVNINADLMSALPGQDVSAWEECLEKTGAVKELTHISAYSLILEEGTPFFERYDENSLPSEEEDRAMYHAVPYILSKYGYSRYEISNYAKKGFECRHNMAYWRRMDYIGAGLGAASCMEGVRRSNIRDMGAYIKAGASDEHETAYLESICAEKDRLTKEDERFETVMLGLRLTEGFMLDKLLSSADKALRIRYMEKLNELSDKGLVIMDKGRVRLTEKGFDLSDHVTRELML